MDSTPRMGPQKVCSHKNGEQRFYIGMGPRKYAPLGMRSRDSIPGNRAPESMLLQEWEVGILPPGLESMDSTNRNGALKSMLPKNREQGFYP